MDDYSGPDPPDTPPPYFESFFPPGRWANIDNFTEVIDMDDYPEGENVLFSPNN